MPFRSAVKEKVRVNIFTKVEGMVVMESVTSLVKPEVAEDGILETERVKLSGLSALQVREKDALGSMLYLLFSPSSTLSEEWRAAMGGAVRSVVNSREPAAEGGHTVKGQVPGEGSSDLQTRDRIIHMLSLYHVPIIPYPIAGWCITLLCRDNCKRCTYVSASPSFDNRHWSSELRP